MGPQTGRFNQHPDLQNENAQTKGKEQMGLLPLPERLARDHGGNKELKALLQAKGKEYASYFQFSLLEVCDLDASEEVVLPREKHWMEVMCSREFGLN